VSATRAAWAAFPWQDLYSFGVIVRDLLRDGRHPRELLCEELGPRNLEALEEIGGRLDDPGANRSRYPGPGYQTARDVLHALDRVSFASMAPMGIPGLAPVPEKGVTLPTSRTRVAGSHRINSVIEHPLFQRLHNLPQLDLIHFVLPGATHTRFVHALHVYDLARMAVCYQLYARSSPIVTAASPVRSNTMSTATDPGTSNSGFIHAGRGGRGKESKKLIAER